MTTEDFTTWTEVDAGGKITVDSATKVSWTLLDNYDTAYLYKDYGTDYFTSFTHDIDLRFSYIEDTAAPLRVHMGYSSTAGTYEGIRFVSPSFFITIREEGANDAKIVVIESDGVSSAVSTQGTYIMQHNTYYYLRIKKTSSNITCYIYSDSDRTTLLDTITHTLIYTNSNYSHMLVPTSQGASAGATGDSTGYLENLNLNPSVDEDEPASVSAIVSTFFGAGII